MMRRTLIVAGPRSPESGAVQTVRLGGGGTAPLYHGGQHYRAGIVRPPRFSTRLAFDDDGWTGGTLPTTGTIVFSPAQASLLNELAALYWKNAAITISAGPDEGPFATVLTGTVADASSASGRLVLTIADLSFGIDKPLVTARFAGSGGIEGFAEVAGRLKRRSWGRCANVEGRVLDKANNIYEFGDPGRPLQGFDAVRDKGNAGAIVGLAWQGSIAATFAALQAATAPAGGAVVAPSIACAKWWTQPSTLTADIRGETSGGYVEDVIGVASRILTAANGPAIANAGTAAGWRPGAAGLHIDNENETAAQAIDRVLLGCSLLWVISPAGTITVRRIGFADPVETLKPIRSTRQLQLRPTKARRIGYYRNHRLHNDGEIAAVLRGSDVAYSDGTLIDAVQPQEAGANKTETRTASAIAGQGTLATQNTASWAAQVSGAGKPADNATVGAVAGINLLEIAGGAILLLAAIKTALGTAAGISGQGALATLNAASWASQVTGSGKPADDATVGAIFGGNLLETVGGVLATLSAFKTALGTSSGISGQGALATLNAASWASQITGPGKPADNATVGAVAGVNLLDALAGALLTLSMIKTSLGTAAGIAGQGALATANSVDYATQVTGKPTGTNKITRSFTGAPSASIELVVEAGATVPLEFSWRGENYSAGGDRTGRIRVRTSGSGSFADALVGTPTYVGPDGPGSDQASGTWTNYTGSKQAFEFRFEMVGSSLTYTPQAQNFISVG